MFSPIVIPYTSDEIRQVVAGLRDRRDPVAAGVVSRLAAGYEHQLGELRNQRDDLVRQLKAAQKPPVPPPEPEPPALTLADAFAAQQAAVEGASARLVEMAQPAPEPPPVALPSVSAPPLPRLPKGPPPPRARA